MSRLAGVHAGQPYEGRISEIVDWGYLKDGQFSSRELVREGRFKTQPLDFASAPLEARDR
jgi:hypothetical protein